MKNIDNLIIKNVLEITALVFIVFVTFPVWQILSESKGALVASYYNNFAPMSLTMYFEKIADFDYIMPMRDEDVSDYSVINVVNNSESEKSYALVLVTDKQSSLNTEYLKVRVNDSRVYELSELLYSENEYSYYFVINTDSINAKSVGVNKVYIWLDENTPNDAQEKELSINFSVLENYNSKFVSLNG